MTLIDLSTVKSPKASGTLLEDSAIAYNCTYNPCRCHLTSVGNLGTEGRDRAEGLDHDIVDLGRYIAGS